MKAFAPNGSPIVGTLESIPAVAVIAPGSFKRRPGGGVAFEWAMETRAFADRRATVWRGNQPIYLAEDGSEWPENQLVLKEEATSDG